MVQAETVRIDNCSSCGPTLTFSVGGKAKPLKAPKKEKKEMDEDEVAFKAKQAAGMGGA